MAFLDVLSSLADAEAAPVGRSMLASLVRQGLTEGLSANAMLRAIATAGMGIRRQSFLQLVGEVRASSARAAQWSSMALDEVPDESMIQEWHGGAATTYLSRVYMYIRSTVGGSLQVERRGMSILTRQPIAPQTALDQATALFTGTHPNTTDAGQTFLGAEFGGVYHQVAG